MILIIKLVKASIVYRSLMVIISILILLVHQLISLFGGIN